MKSYAFFGVLGSPTNMKISVEHTTKVCRVHYRHRQLVKQRCVVYTTGVVNLLNKGVLCTLPASSTCYPIRMKICAFHETHGALTNIAVLDERQVVTRVGVVYYLVQVCMCVIPNV